MTGRVIALVGLLAAGCRPPTLPPPAQADGNSLPQPATFAHWPTVTEKPVEVSQELWGMCREPTPEEKKRRDADEATHGPHTIWTIVVRTDPASADAFRRGKPLPVGAVVVKEKYTNRRAATIRTDENGTGPMHGYAMMVKREPGYDADHGDWQYVWSSPYKGGPPDGRLETCRTCHAKAKDRDYLFRTYLTGRGP